MSPRWVTAPAPSTLTWATNVGTPAERGHQFVTLVASAASDLPGVVTCVRFAPRLDNATPVFLAPDTPVILDPPEKLP